MAQTGDPTGTGSGVPNALMTDTSLLNSPSMGQTFRRLE